MYINKYYMIILKCMCKLNRFYNLKVLIFNYKYNMWIKFINSLNMINIILLII